MNKLSPLMQSELAGKDPFLTDLTIAIQDLTFQDYIYGIIKKYSNGLNQAELLDHYYDANRLPRFADVLAKQDDSPRQLHKGYSFMPITDMFAHQDPKHIPKEIGTAWKKQPGNVLALMSFDQTVDQVVTCTLLQFNTKNEVVLPAHNLRLAFGYVRACYLNTKPSKHLANEIDWLPGEGQVKFTAGKH